MREYIYKVIIFIIAIIIIFEFTLGRQIDKFNEQFNFLSSKEGRKEIILSLKKEMKKANEKENFLNEEERVLINNFINKIKKELGTKN